MKRNFFSLIVTALAVFGLITACDDGGGKDNGKDDGKKSEYTVTFNRNHRDATGYTEANPKTMTVKAGEFLPELPSPPTRSAGWGLGTYLEGWYTDKECTKYFDDENTKINTDMILYAKWEYRPGQEEVVGDTLVHNAPLLEKGGVMHGTWNGDINDDGSATWQGGGIRYKYPDAGLDYDYVEIEYIGKDKDGRETGSISSNILKQYNTSSPDYKPGVNADGTQYPTLPLPSGKLIFQVRGGTGGDFSGLAIQINNPGPDKLRTMKFTKATFTRGKRFKVTFDPNYPGAAAIPEKEIAENLTIGTLPYLERQGGKDFVGWTLASDTNTLITESYVVTSALALKAKWETFAAGTAFTVDFKAANIGLTPVGTGTAAEAFTEGSDTGYTFTYGSGNYNTSWAKFNVTLNANVRLSAYKEVTIQYQSVSGDTAYKPFALLAAATLPASLPADPHTGQYKVSSDTPQGNTTSGTTWASMKFTIDKSKAAGLTGTIQVCIYDHSAATKDGDKTAWKIKNVTFTPDD